jgi:hypothetical protein
LPYPPGSRSPTWGSAGYAFHQAESLLPAGSSAVTVPDDLASGGSLLRWRAAPGATLRFNLRVPAESGAARLGFTLAHQPGGGTFSVYLNGQPVPFGRQTGISTHADHRKVLRNHISGPVSLKKGANEIRLEAGDAPLDGVVTSISSGSGPNSVPVPVRGGFQVHIPAYDTQDLTRILTSYFDI